MMMDGPWFVLFVVTLWIAVGLATMLWMARRGHRSPGWILLAAVFGPVLALTANERVQRVPRTLARTRAEQEPPSGLRVLVGVDGSPQSQAALDLALRLVGPYGGTVTAAEVVDYDAAESEENVDVARERLDTATHRAEGRDLSRVVLAGPPASALAHFGRDQDIDVIVVGRHGRGLSKRLLGNVTQELLRTAGPPVLVVGGTGGPSGRAGPPDG